jgi:uncharacterized protein DUF4184
MPWTFAHPATVLPLRRLCPVYLSFAGHAIGSMTPDLGYYIHLSGLAHLAHTFAGSILVCLPTGLALFAALYLLRKPFWFILPQPHRAVIEPVVASFSTPRLFAAANSIVFGAWTHIFWDHSLIRTAGWSNTLSFFRKPAFRLGFNGVPNLSTPSISQQSAGHGRTGRGLLYVVAFSPSALSSFPTTVRALAIHAIGGDGDHDSHNRPS